MSDLPVGVHPQDQRGFDAGVIGVDLPSMPTAMKNAFNTSSADALSVFQRAAHNWDAKTVNVSTANPTAQAAGRLKGRVRVDVWVPSSASVGVMIAENQGILEAGGGVELAPGDSIAIPTEASIYVGLVSGQTTGTANVAQYFNEMGSDR